MSFWFQRSRSRNKNTAEAVSYCSSKNGEKTASRIIAYNFVARNFSREGRTFGDEVQTTEKPRFMRLSSRFAPSLWPRRPRLSTQCGIRLSVNTAERDVCVYAADTSIRVVAVRQILFHRKTIKRRPRLRPPPLRSRPGNCKSMGCVFYLNSHNGARETERNANLQFQNTPILSTKGERKEGRGGRGEDRTGFKISVASSSSFRRDCYFSLDFLSLARR
jgi:hypothetical protein